VIFTATREADWVFTKPIFAVFTNGPRPRAAQE
jgi:hypothetical protein